MGVRLCEELDASRLVELLEFLQHLRCVHFELLYAYAGEREGHFEILAVLLGHFEEGAQCRHIGTFGDVGDKALVLVVVVIIMVGTDIEETVTFEMNDLVYLKIKTYRFHCRRIFTC